MNITCFSHSILTSFLFFCFLGEATLAQPIYVEKNLPEFPGFLASNGSRNLTMKCDGCTTFYSSNGTLSTKGFGGLWTAERSYDVSNGGKLIVEISVRLHIDREISHERGSELIIGFSDNLLPWGDPGADALTFRIGCDDKENNFLTVVRDKMYANYISNSSRYILPPEKWEVVRIVLTSEKMIAYVAGQEIVQADLSRSTFPRKGHIGILSYRKVPAEISYMRISQ